MTTYKEIKGQLIRQVSSDPSNPLEGQVWYNKTIGVLKSYKNIGGAWASGGSINTARHRVGSAGTQTAALMFGGTSGFQTESYDGSSWTSLANMSRSTGNQMGAGCGNQTAALGFGGYGPPSMNSASEVWNGSSWTATPSINTARASGGGAGTSTSALFFGGYQILPPGNTYGSFNNTEEFDGSSWTNGGVLSQTRTGVVGSGTQTAGLGSGGMNPIPSAGLSNTEEYNGSSWSGGGSLGTARYGAGASSSGTQTASIIFAGSSPINTKGALTESYNGTSWTELADMAVQRYEVGGFGVQTAALAAGGSPTSLPTVSEEFTDPSFGVQKITTS